MGMFDYFVIGSTIVYTAMKIVSTIVANDEKSDDLPVIDAVPPRQMPAPRPPAAAPKPRAMHCVGCGAPLFINSPCAYCRREN